MRSPRFSSSLLLLLPLVVPLALACSSKATLLGKGQECQLATDCQDGLICAPQKNGSSTCTSDLSGVQQLPPNPDAGGAAAPPANTDASAATDAAPASVPDASAGG